MAISLVSLNVERSNHLERVVPFLQEQSPDIFCIQELCRRDIPRFETMGKLIRYAPMTRYGEDEDPLLGIGMFSRLSYGDARVEYYRGGPERMLDFDEESPETKYQTENAMCIFADLSHGGETYTIGTTHFTWTPDGQSNAQQQTDLKAMQAILDTTPEFVLCGDFNAPRGGDIFTALSAQYRDNIPAEYQTSIDITLHRLGGSKGAELSRNMVDGLFTTPHYRASDVRLVPGISDHMAVVASIART